MAQNGPKQAKKWKITKKGRNNLKKSRKIKKKLKKYFWSKKMAQNGPKLPKIVQKMENYQKGLKKSEKITKNS